MILVRRSEQCHSIVKTPWLARNGGKESRLFSPVRDENGCGGDFESDDFLSGLVGGSTGHVRVIRIDHFT
jgi:hypothetical protein